MDLSRCRILSPPYVGTAVAHDLSQIDGIINCVILPAKVCDRSAAGLHVCRCAEAHDDVLLPVLVCSAPSVPPSLAHRFLHPARSPQLAELSLCF